MTVKLILPLLVFLASCSAQHTSSQTDAAGRSILVEGDADVPIIDVDSDDAGCGENVHCGDDYEYQQRCWKYQTFFCTPDGHPPGSDPALYQQQVLLDICDADGNPCVPTGPNDENCKWEVIDMGECEDWLECDPTDPAQQEQEVECEGVDDSGASYYGVQTVYCIKGQLHAGPCEPCDPEICDGIDNDCDGDIDEGLYPCETICGEGEAACINGELMFCSAPEPEEEVCDWVDNDCDGLVDENQRNACDSCGLVPPETCDAIDNDCDGEVDEDLVDICSTACEDGFQICVDGQWGACTAQQPVPEECNGFDDDCDGLVDEDLSCECDVDDVGVLIPCMEEPLVCGQGLKTCECLTPECTETQMTPCKAACVYFPPPEDGVCDELLGLILPEACNNWDDNCNQLIDEDLFTECYTGPDGTEGVGICLPGEMTCSEGVWGGNTNNGFVPEFCVGEVLPAEQDLCNGVDDNCDGVVEELQETDVLFIIDGSGSMQDEIDAVLGALSMFAANYADQQTVQWGIVLGPTDGEQLVLIQNLTGFEQFIINLANLPEPNGGAEMLYDALYLAAHNLATDPNLLPYQIVEFVGWSGAADGSNPGIQNFIINWREDANKVIILFTDEEGQSYLNPELEQEDVLLALTLAEDLSVYTFSPAGLQHNTLLEDGWGPLAIGGSWRLLSNDQAEMFESLMDVLDESVCGN
jgi:hypothetical protein